MIAELSLVRHFTRYANRVLLRNPGAAFSTLFLPLFFLVVFTLSFGHETLSINGQQVKDTTFTLAAILVYSIAQACYTNLAVTSTIARESGLLKRIRGTPIPPRSYLLGQAVNVVQVSLLLVAVSLAVACLAFGVRFPAATLPALTITLVVGALAFSLLGLAISAAIPNADAATAVVNLSIFPLFFASNVFIPFGRLPQWFDALTQVFPVRPFSEAIKLALVPTPGSHGFDVADPLELTGWAIIGLVASVRWFRWEPRR